jgi:hypothetical protein
MERDGVITGYHAHEPACAGRKLLVFVEITLNQKSVNMFEQFRARCCAFRKCRNAIWCRATSIT